MLEQMLRSVGAVEEGKFVLSSGQQSKYYVNIKKIVTNPHALRVIANQMSHQMVGDKIAAVELGAVPLAVSISLMTDIPYLIIRKKRKDYGLKSQIEGNYIEGEKVTLIEDVITTGGTVKYAVETLRAIGLDVLRVVAVVDRDEGGEDVIKDLGVDYVVMARLEDLL